jgi:hypothetical protein
MPLSRRLVAAFPRAVFEPIAGEPASPGETPGEPAGKDACATVRWVRALGVESWFVDCDGKSQCFDDCHGVQLDKSCGLRISFEFACLLGCIYCVTPCLSR